MLSVVAMACAARVACLRLRRLTQAGSFAVILSACSGSPITPVEQTKIEDEGRSRLLASASTVERVSCRPRSPVPALAQPELTRIARARPLFFFKCSRLTVTGAAAQQLRVKQAAALAGRSETMIARSRPAFLRPARSAAARKPRAAQMPPGQFLQGGRDTELFTCRPQIRVN